MRDALVAGLVASAVVSVGTAQKGARVLPPFPGDDAKFVIRGRVGADAPLAKPKPGGSLATRVLRKYGAEQDPLTLGLPNVIVTVEGLERRWRFTLAPAATYDFRTNPPPKHLVAVRSQKTKIRGHTTLVRRNGRTLLIDKAADRFVCCRTVEHPIFAVSDEHGFFELPALPAGTYTVVADHIALGKVRTKVVIGDRRPKPLRLEMKVPKSARGEPVGPADPEMVRGKRMEELRKRMREFMEKARGKKRKKKGE